MIFSRPDVRHMNWALLPAQATVLIALLQPAPEVYNLFDDILLLAEGCVIFHGPKDEVCCPCMLRVGSAR